MQLAAANVVATTRAVPPRLVDVARDALRGLEPVVVVNRRIDVASAQVAGAAPDDPFPTIHDDPRGDVRTATQRILRVLKERARGVHGDGPDAGRTVYGSVRFVPGEDASTGADAIVAALRRQGNPGVRAYGPVSFVTDPTAIADRTTYAADDSGATLVRIRGRDELARVVAERLERSQDLDGTPKVDELLELEPAAARDAVRGWLLSDALAHHDGYVEAQVRRLAPKDVLAVLVDERPGDVARRLTIDPGPAPGGDDASRLAQELRRLDLPLHRIDAWQARPPSTP